MPELKVFCMEILDKIARVTIHRTDRRNTMNQDFRHELPQVFTFINDCKAIHAAGRNRQSTVATMNHGRQSVLAGISGDCPGTALADLPCACDMRPIGLSPRVRDASPALQEVPQGKFPLAVRGGKPVPNHAQEHGLSSRLEHVALLHAGILQSGTPALAVSALPGRQTAILAD